MAYRLSFALLVCVACARASRANDASTPADTTTERRQVTEEPVTLRILMQEANTGFRDSLRVVAKDADAWAELWRRAQATMGDVSSPPTVDFSREMVVLAALGQRASGGHSIHLDNARIRSGSLEVFVHSRSPGPNCITTMALTRPAIAAAVMRTTLPVRFVEVLRIRNC